MSSNELWRVGVLARVAEAKLSVSDAAVILRLSYRQAKRIWRRYREEGAEGLRHRSAGGESNRSKCKKFRERVLRMVRKKASVRRWRPST
jgi:transposase